MSRREPTEAERVTGDALVCHLRDLGRRVADFEHGDRPDLRFRVDGELIGCECVQIPPDRILKRVHARFKQVGESVRAKGFGAVRIIWPQEPHVWVREAIRQKSSLLSEYRKNSGCDRISLLIHAPISETDRTIRYKNESVMQMIGFAAQSPASAFCEIYFWAPDTGIEKLVPRSPPWTPFRVDFERGYPTDGFVLGGGVFTTTKDGEPPKIFDHGIVEPELIIVPPEDPEFQRHEPNFERRRYRMRVTAEATTARVSYDQILDEEK
jgi:hypothetical protein